MVDMYMTEKYLSSNRTNYGIIADNRKLCIVVFCNLSGVFHINILLKIFLSLAITPLDALSCIALSQAEAAGGFYAGRRTVVNSFVKSISLISLWNTVSLLLCFYALDLVCLHFILEASCSWSRTSFWKNVKPSQCEPSI